MTASSVSLPVDVHGYGALGSRPAAGIPGREYVDSSTLTRYRDNGTSWDNLTPAGGSGTLATIEELDGSPTNAAVTKLRFPNGTLGIAGSVATYTPAVSLAHSFSDYNVAGATWETFTSLRVYCKSIVLAADSLVTSIDAYVRQSTDNVFGLIASVLTDNAGAPGLLVATSGGGPTAGGLYMSQSASMPGTAHWLSLPIGAWLPAGTYWICVQNGSARVDLAYDAGSDQIFTASVFAATSAYPSAWAITNSSRKYSLRASLLA